MSTSSSSVSYENTSEGKVGGFWFAFTGTKAGTSSYFTKKNLSKMIILVDIILLNCVVLGFGMYLLVNNSSSKEADQLNDSESLLSTEPCGSSWITFNNEKCYKVLDQLKNFDDALKACRQLGPTTNLLTIQSKAENDFLLNLLLDSDRVVDDIWLGATITPPDGFKWLQDNIEFTFNNYHYILNISNRQNQPNQTSCLQFQAKPAPSYGNIWFEASCTKKNAVICEKRQIWSLSMAQKQLKEAKREVEQLKKSSVPVGSTYIQFVGESSPGDLWPANFKWEILSSESVKQFSESAGISNVWKRIE